MSSAEKIWQLLQTFWVWHKCCLYSHLWSCWASPVWRTRLRCCRRSSGGWERSLRCGLDRWRPLPRTRSTPPARRSTSPAGGSTRSTLCQAWAWFLVTQEVQGGSMVRATSCFAAPVIISGWILGAFLGHLQAALWLIGALKHDAKRA